MKKAKGFTLVDFLIVAAAIAILAAIAIPNFAVSQQRAKISRVKNDLRSLSVAMEAYHIDIKKYPCAHGGAWSARDLWAEYLTGLSTPVAYIPSVKLSDPFQPISKSGWSWQPQDFYGSYFYVQFGDADGPAHSWGAMMRLGGQNKVPNIDGFTIASYGPNRTYDYIEYACLDTSVASGPWPLKVWGFPGAIYDSSNGTISAGDIARFGGAMPVTSTP